jgi:hypothetical protein
LSRGKIELIETYLGDEVWPGNFELAGDIGLAEAAGGRRVLQPVF